MHPCPWTMKEYEDGDFEELVVFEIYDALGRDLFSVKELTFAHDGITGEERGAAGRQDARALAEFIVRKVNGSALS